MHSTESSACNDPSILERCDREVPLPPYRCGSISGGSEGLAQGQRPVRDWIELRSISSRGPRLHCWVLLLRNLFSWCPDGKTRAQMVLPALQMPHS